jgi:hypothetical protein
MTVQQLIDALEALPDKTKLVHLDSDDLCSDITEVLEVGECVLIFTW